VIVSTILPTRSSGICQHRRQLAVGSSKLRCPVTFPALLSGVARVIVRPFRFRAGELNERGLE
jgi:hypothetical protein